MNSGNRTSSIFVVVLLGAFAAADAGRTGEDGTGAMWVAPELLEALAATRFAGCAHEMVAEAAEVQSDGRVAFEWHPATGELSFADAGTPALTLPADFVPAASPAVMQSCESR